MAAGRDYRWCAIVFPDCALGGASRVRDALNKNRPRVASPPGGAGDGFVLRGSRSMTHNEACVSWTRCKTGVHCSTSFGRFACCCDNDAARPACASIASQFAAVAAVRAVVRLHSPAFSVASIIAVVQHERGGFAQINFRQSEVTTRLRQTVCPQLFNQQRTRFAFAFRYYN